MGAHDKRDSERITIRWPRYVGHYRAEYVPSMSPPHRNTGLINTLASLPGVISVQTLQNLKGLHISVLKRCAGSSAMPSAVGHHARETPRCSGI